MKDVLLFHWKEEAQHAVIDELEWRRENAGLTAFEADPEPVARAVRQDGGGGGHSLFARALLEALEEMPEKVFTANELFSNKVKPKAIEYAFVQWSRPANLFNFGVRPNSVTKHTSVSARRPRWLRSSISAAKARSVEPIIGHVPIPYRPSPPGTPPAIRR